MMRERLKGVAKVCFSSIFLVMLSFSIFAPLGAVFAAGVDCVPGTKGCDYVPLTTIPGATVGCKPTGYDGNNNPIYDLTKCQPANPIKVITNIYGVSIGIAAVLAVGVIIWAGVEYLTKESITGKSDAKERWHGALWGLLLLLSSFLILRTINVDLVNINLELGQPLKGEVVDVEKAKLQAVQAAAQSAQKNLESSLQKATTGEANTQSQLDEINKKLKDPNLTAEEKSKLLADYAYASAINEFRKGDVAIYNELTDINKKIASGQSASFGVTLSKINSSIEGLKSTLEQPLDARLKLAVEERIKTLTRQKEDLNAVTAIVTNQNRIYTRAVDFYGNAKPSVSGMSVDQFRRELITREILDSSKSGTPMNLIQSIAASRHVATPEINSVAQTYNNRFSSGINTALESRVKCYELTTTRGGAAATAAGCKSF
jgi:hypothetical protein